MRSRILFFTAAFCAVFVLGGAYIALTIRSGASDLDRVTVDDIITVARETFKNDQVTLVTLGPPEIGDLDLGSISFS